MNKTLTRVGVLATVAAAAVAVSVAPQAASADDGDAVTGGSSTFTVPQSAVSSLAGQGVVVIPTSPATLSFDQPSESAVYTFTVTGGDGSVNSGYGSVKHSGGLRIIDAKTHHSATLSSLTFAADDLTLSLTPAGSKRAIDFATAGGSHTESFDRPSGRQEESATDVTLDAPGAAYLNKALNVTTFVAGQDFGSFDTVFYNSQY